jgi:hypothetical protein
MGDLEWILILTSMVSRKKKLAKTCIRKKHHWTQLKPWDLCLVEWIIARRKLVGGQGGLYEPGAGA